MTNKIEQVARVLFPATFESDDNSSKRYALSQARAAIEAMREPTDAMDKKGNAVLDDGALYVWQAMIDAALKEE